MNSSSGWKRVFIAEHPLQAATMATALEAEGLTPQLRGMELWGVAVEILFSEGAAPSVWVPEVQEQQALQVVQRMRSPQQDKRWDWTCPQCNERVPGSFETCWQCGQLSPDCSEPDDAGDADDQLAKGRQANALPEEVATDDSRSPTADQDSG